MTVRKLDALIKLGDKELELLTTNKSTIQLVILERRTEEKFCMEQAQCLFKPTKEPMFSLYFSGCLLGDEEP